MKPTKHNTTSLFGIALIVATQAHAADTSREIRPSHLLNMETAGTLGAGQLILGEFGSSGRVAYGVTDQIETRLDLGFLSQSQDRSNFTVGVSAKFRIWGNDNVGIGTEGQIGSVKAIDGTPLATYSARIPITFKFAPALLTVAPLYSQGLAADSPATSGAEFGLAFPLMSSLDAILETSFTTTDGVSGTGYTSGVVFKPTPRVSIPLVFASKQAGGQPSVGLVGLFALIGFEP